MNNDLPLAIHFHFDVDEKLTIYFAWPNVHSGDINTCSKVNYQVIAHHAGSQLPRCDSKWATTQQTDFSVKSFEKEQQGPASLVLSANKPRRYTVVLPDPQGV